MDHKSCVRRELLRRFHKDGLSEMRSVALRCNITLQLLQPRWLSRRIQLASGEAAQFLKFNTGTFLTRPTWAVSYGNKPRTKNIVLEIQYTRPSRRLVSKRFLEPFKKVPGTFLKGFMIHTNTMIRPPWLVLVIWKQKQNLMVLESSGF